MYSPIIIEGRGSVPGKIYEIIKHYKTAHRMSRIDPTEFVEIIRFAPMACTAQIFATVVNSMWRNMVFSCMPRNYATLFLLMVVK